MPKDLSPFGSDQFLERLRTAFDSRGWKQIPFVEHVKAKTGESMTQPRLSAILSGRANVTFREVELLAAGLDMTPGGLLFGESATKSGRPRERVPSKPIVKHTGRVHTPEDERERNINPRKRRA